MKEKFLVIRIDTVLVVGSHTSFEGALEQVIGYGGGSLAAILHMVKTETFTFLTNISENSGSVYMVKDSETDSHKAFDTYEDARKELDNSSVGSVISYVEKNDLSVSSIKLTHKYSKGFFD